MRKFTAVFIILFFLLSAGKQIIAQNSQVNITDIKFTVSRADDWTALLKRNNGWFGGDGIYTIPMDGREHKYADKNSKTLFIFSDTMIGSVTDSAMQPGYKMIHNSVAYLTGNQPDASKIKFGWKQTQHDEAEPVFEPATSHTKTGDYYWLGDGFVDQKLNNTLYIFGYRVHNFSSDAFGFREVGNTIIKVPLKSKLPIALYQQFDTPFYSDKNGAITSFGAGIYVNTKKAGAPSPDGFIYVYGVKGIDKQLLVARVEPQDFEKFNNWRFWDGENWSTKMASAKAVTNSVSNELSLTALPDGRYALIFQVGGMTDIVGMRIGASPAGPFGPIIKLWDCKPDLEKKTYVVYNAKAHPALSKPGELLISYNINSVEFIKDMEQNPHLYRPRFIRLKFK